MRKHKLLWSVLVGCSLLAGCKEAIPDDVIQPGRMESLLYDYHLSKAMTKNLPQAESYKLQQYYQYVFDKHGVTKAEFDSSMVWYARHTEELASIYDRLKERMHKQQDQINHLIAIRDNKPKESAPGDSVDIWVGNRLYALQGSPVLNRVVFEIPTDKNFEQRDWFVWKFRYTFTPLFTPAADTAIVSVYAKYTNDSIRSVSRLITQSGIDSLTLRTDSVYKLMNLKGYIYYQGENPDRGMLIDEIQLKRYRYVPIDTLKVDEKAGSSKQPAEMPAPEVQPAKVPEAAKIMDARVADQPADKAGKRKVRGRHPKERKQ